MTAYYNEFDPFAAQWLRNLIDAKLIAPGIVDDRSITDVTASDLKGFTQCHFFAGIGGWSLALRLAGVPDNFRCWTGSPPCQPFSTAGKQLGQLDDRHLAPTFMRLISQCKPSVIFGEQVAAAIAKHWLDDLFTELENESYACGAAVLPACSIGAPHKRDRLFFGACSLVYPYNECEQSTGNGARLTNTNRPSEASGRLAQPVRSEWNGERLHGLGENNQAQGGGASAEFAGRGCTRCMDDTKPFGRNSRRDGNHGENDWQQLDAVGEIGGAIASNGFWSGADWLGCRDGKFRAVEPGTFPLANGIPARVGRLRGYGNAIVPQVAAEFISAFLTSVNEVVE